MFKRSSSLLLAVRGKSLAAVLILVFATGFVGSNCALAANISGAIFTTDGPSCTGTNVNLFDAKVDVYLDGGPHHEGAAGLPDGDYYVRVTSPSGQDLLGTSIGASNQTPVHVTNGKFYVCYQLWAILVNPSNGNSVGYADTTNNGGVYKVWVSKDSAFANDHSKTDNFKVKGSGPNPCENSVITVRKFDDSNANGIQDIGENDVNWPINGSDPSNSPINVTATVDIQASAGKWLICEEPNSDWRQTALIVDGEPCSITTCADVNVLSDCEDNHTVVFGNIKLANITACKFYDSNGNGVRNNGEPPVGGIRFALEGDDITGSHISQLNTTDLITGCVTFGGLLPGSYTLNEILPPGTPDNNWIATTDPCKVIELAEGDKRFFEFGNVCTGTADFDTKGYWHNKNGLDETVLADFAYLNSRAPWTSCGDSSAKPFGPIDGHKCGSNSTLTVTIGGTTYTGVLAEQSLFLVYKNSIVKLQLAQQLDAFIMNVLNRPSRDNPIGLNGVIQLPDGSWKVVSQLITDAENAWISGSAAQRTLMSSLLDALNNSDVVLFIHYEPCPVVYP